MATVPVKAENKLSFAKVVASGGKENSTPTFARIVAATPALKQTTAKANSRDNVPETTRQFYSTNNVTSSVAPGPNIPGIGQVVVHSVVREVKAEESAYDTKLVDAVKAINLESSTPSLVVNGSGSSVIYSTPISSETSPDDPFQRPDSGSELGTKPPSLDGKSITSGTTFALDEKESLRPDDSASVKAAEDDDAFSGRGSIVAGSRIGSEAAARAYRAQTYEVSDRRAIAPTSEPQGILTPQSGSSGQQIMGEAHPKPLGPSVSGEGFSLFYKQTPDEKLLEALDSPKDRIFLLRLEQDLITFVKDSKEPYIDLPPCNSFCRLLTHKLADYYHMTHQYDSVAQSVRIFRTPFCRLPQSLTSISNPPTSGNTPPPTMPAMKIMRRGGDGGAGGSPSKATSESGSDGKDKGLSAKEKLSREEREAAYNKARERIFGNSEKTGDATPDTEDGQDISRSSSVSVKDKLGPGKRGKVGKQRRDDSESFDVRSQYTPFFPPQQQPAWSPAPQYGPMGAPPFGSNMQNTFQATPPPPFGQPPQQFHPAFMTGGGMQPYNQMPQNQMSANHMVPNQMQQQYPRVSPPQYQPHSAPITAYGSPVQNPPQQPQQWSPHLYQSPYQTRGPMLGQPSIPYPYGQLPSTVNPADPKSQHPIPGSFNRHAFNPKTQSFVPGNSGMLVQQPMSHHGSPLLPYNGFPSPPQYNNGMGYNMSRQGSNTSLPSYHASPHMASRPMMHQGMAPNGPPHGNHLPHFGNMSSLPPKPPPAM